MHCGLGRPPRSPKWERLTADIYILNKEAAGNDPCLAAGKPQMWVLTSFFVLTTLALVWLCAAYFAILRFVSFLKKRPVAPTVRAPRKGRTRLGRAARGRIKLGRAAAGFSK